VLRTAVNECLDPMKEATSNDVAFLVSETPHWEAIGGGVLRGYGYVQPEREIVALDSVNEQF